jgi:hypothetical protein
MSNGRTGIQPEASTKRPVLVIRAFTQACAFYSPPEHSGAPHEHDINSRNPVFCSGSGVQNRTECKKPFRRAAGNLPTRGLSLLTGQETPKTA